MEVHGQCGLDERQAAKKLGLSVSTLRAWRFRGTGPAYCKLGRRVLYLPDDLDTFLSSRRIIPMNAA